MGAGPIDSINAYFPFMFGNELDPRFIFGVGEQVIAEYLFALHARKTRAGRAEGLFSRIKFDQAENRVTVRLNGPVFQSDGKEIPFSAICSGLKESLQGTRHAPYGSLLRQFRCNEAQREVEIEFVKIPVNLEFLFTIPDFSLFSPEAVPVRASNRMLATGPYFLKSSSAQAVLLQRNHFYPQELRANDVETIQIVNYRPDQSREFIAQADPLHHHAVYYFGHALEPDDLSTLREKGYRVEEFPNEWFVYFLIKEQVSQPLRKALEQAIDSFRRDEVRISSLGLPAYSTAPGGRAYALSELEYARTPAAPEVSFDPQTPFKISVLSTWASMPFNARILTYLKSCFPRMELDPIEPANAMKLFSKDTDIALSLLGIDPSDALSHLAFFESVLVGFSDIVSKEELSSLAIAADRAALNEGVKAVEMRIRNSGLVIPIAHFPGIVAQRADFQRDDSIAFGWGIQTWSFRIAQDENLK